MLQKRVQDGLKWVSIILESLIETYLGPRQCMNMIKLMRTYNVLVYLSMATAVKYKIKV